MTLRPPPLLISDATALDFLNSVVSLPDKRMDFLDDGEGLLSWMTEARLVDAGAADQIRASCTGCELDHAAARAREMREWFRGFVDARKGRKVMAYDLPALKPLNDMLAMDDTYTRLVPHDGSPGYPYQLATIRRQPGGARLLMTIAETLARFVCADAMVRVKSCEGPGCTLVFEDRTPMRTRRWCSVALCGHAELPALHSC